jgi:hypothetical protein
MNIFKIFKKTNNPVEEIIPSKKLFIEESEEDNLNNNLNLRKYNLDSIYDFAETDYEEKGYNDALINPDNSYKTDNIKLLRYDFQIKIKRAYKTYEDYIKDIEFHIDTRKNAGLVDTVKLLETELVKIKDSIEEVKNIENDYENETGLIERISLSYQRGFMRGLAAMSDQILDRDV